MSWPQVARGTIAVIDRTLVQPGLMKGRYVGLEHLDSEGGICTEHSIGVDDLASSKFRFSTQHVLFGKLRPYLRKVARPKFDGICSTDILPILPKAGLNKDYLFHYLRSPAVIDLATARSSGANLPRISPSVLADFLVPLPPPEKQNRIAAILDKADDIRRKREQAIQLADDFLRSLFLEMFGDPIRNPKGWPFVSLSDCASVVDCPHSTPIWQTEGPICIRTSNLGLGSWDWTDTRRVSASAYHERSTRLVLEPDDIVLSREGTLGVAAVITPGLKACLGQRLCAVRAKPNEVNPRFLLEILLELLHEKNTGSQISGSTAKHINVAQIRTFRILFPPLDLQLRFAALANKAIGISQKQNLMSVPELNCNNL